MHLFLISGNKSAAYGGIERWMIDTAAGLAARGVRTTVIGRPGTLWLRAAARAGLRVRGDIHGAWVQRVLRVGAAMRRERPDVVIAKGKKVARWAAFGRAMGGGGRLVLRFGLTHELDRKRWIDRFTWRHVDAGIIAAEGAARWYVDHGFGPASKLHVLWKGVDLARFEHPDGTRAAVRASLGLAPDAVAACMVGRLAWEKGIDVLFDAARRAIESVPAVRFFVVGGGRDAEAVAAAAGAPELRGAVTVLGQREDVPRLLAGMDIAVQSSRREVMAQATLEGMTAGLPIVSTRTMGADEAIEDGRSGILVPVGDAGALADAVVALAGDPARRAAMGRAARERIVAHFTAAQALDRCDAILRRVAAAEGLPR
jgi:glycosyltransferase involved in cell wall biosynthesis